ncbi:MAG: hypothetical protein ACLP3R_03835 [Candidatus Korobacteraceae bacterium]|jgi:hypothetical protein
MKIGRWLLASVAMTSLFSAMNAQAQWVMVARAVAGRIERMSNKPSTGSGYDVATVVLEANASKVYQTALQVMEARPDITITSQDAQKKEIRFSKGDQVASMQATSLGDKICQLVVASSLNGTSDDGTSIVVQGIMKVCQQMDVVCTLSQ